VKFNLAWKDGNLTLQDFVDMCSQTANWCSQAANEYAKQWNDNAVQNLDILKRDLTDLMNPQGMSKMSATELRQKTIQEIYQMVKNDVVSNRDCCKSVSCVRSTSPKILDEIRRMLESEGFDVECELQPSSTIITVEW
jgi:hypothetical protein